MMNREPKRGPEDQLNLPPGFRFYPSDEELVVHYLCKKAAAQSFAVPIIAEVDLYKFDPWDLPEKALFGEKEWYFFSPRDRKYPNGSRPNRAAASGYWKATGTDKPICTMAGRLKVGVKKALVFYTGKAPKGVKTNWIMHEYRLADSATKAARRKGSLRLDDWVLCRIYKKMPSAMRLAAARENESSGSFDEVLASLPEIDDAKLLNNLPRLNSLKGAGGATAAVPAQYLQQFSQQPLLNLNYARGLPYDHYAQSEEDCKQTMRFLPHLQMLQKPGMTTNGSARSQGMMFNDSAASANTSKIVEQSHNQSPETHDSPVNSSVVDEESGQQQFGNGFFDRSGGSGAFRGSDSFQLFGFDGLPSPFGRTESLQSFFPSLAGDANDFSLANPDMKKLPF